MKTSVLQKAAVLASSAALLSLAVATPTFARDWHDDSSQHWNDDCGSSCGQSSGGGFGFFPCDFWSFFMNMNMHMPFGGGHASDQHNDNDPHDNGGYGGNQHDTYAHDNGYDGNQHDNGGYGGNQSASVNSNASTTVSSNINAHSSNDTHIYQH